ncbi:unnamed protein product [Withania somnifera]
MGDKLHRREGNSPDYQLRPLNDHSVINENVGFSNANIGENPMPKKPKGSSARFIHGGVRRGRENTSSQCSNTRHYDTKVTHAILPGKARTTLSKRVPIPETDTGR